MSTLAASRTTSLLHNGATHPLAARVSGYHVAFLAGIVADRAGPTAAFALAGGPGALAVLTTLLRSRTITPPRHSPQSAGTDAEPPLGHRAIARRPASDLPQPVFAEVGGP